jgi:hypothetical protein
MRPARAIHVMTRRLPRQRRPLKVTTSIPQEQTKTAPANATKARVTKGRAHATPSKAKPAPKATRITRKAVGGRRGSKTAKILDLLKRPDGATLKELMKATGWQAHSVRGFLSGTLGKKMRTPVESFKSGDGERSYRTSSK